MATDIGRVIIAIDGALRIADFRSDSERRQFCEWFAKSCPERMRQMLLTWRANDLPADELARMQALDKARREGVISGV